MASKNVLRLTMGPSGLFDTGSTDLSSFDVVTESDILKAAVDQSDLLKVVVDQSDLFPMLNDVVQEEGDLIPSPGFQVMGDQFFDAFTDLTAFLEGEENSQTSKKVTAFDTIAIEAVASSVPTLEENAEKSLRKRKLESISSDDESDEEQKKSKITEKSPKTGYSKYRERRDKNNVASKRSRETRKMKESDLEQKAVELEESNNKLRETVEELTAHTEFLRKKLIETLSARGTGQNKI